MKAKVEGRPCHFKAHRCSSYESYMREECQDCGEGGCTIMGPDALATRPRTNEKLVKMYLFTLDKVGKSNLNSDRDKHETRRRPKYTEASQ